MCLEEGTQSTWLDEILSPHAEEVLVVMVSESRGQKNDAKDAFTLAEQLRTGAIPKHVFKEVGELAKRYWRLPEDATLRDVVLVVRADEAHHRDVNHGFANELGGLPSGDVAACPPHVALELIWKKAA